MLKLGTSYAKYFNIKYEQVGSLFQSRFRAKLVDNDEYLQHLSRYIHRNPKEILLQTPGVELRNYRWSSYPSYISDAKGEIIERNIILAYFAKNKPKEDYKSFVEYEQRGSALLIKDLLFEDF